MKKIFVLLILFSGAVQASTLTIGFENVENTDVVSSQLPWGGTGKSLEADGYTFYLNGGLNAGIVGTTSNNLLYSDGIKFGDSARISFSQTNGQNFALYDFSSRCDFCVVQGLTDTGLISTTDHSDLGKGAWLNLMSVDIFREPGDGASLDVDNIILGEPALVPLPAAVWLFGSSLMALGWLRRRS